MSNPIVSFDEQAVKDELRELIRKTIEETIIEMCLAGVSTRRIEDASETLWGAGVSAGTVSNLNDKALESVEEWRCRPLACECPYVYVDGIYLKRSWGGSYENVAVTVAIGVNEEGYREVIGCAEGFTESAERWRDFLLRLLRRLLLLPLLLRVLLLRLRAILLTVHDRCPFIQAGRMKNARTVTDAGIVFMRHKVTLDAAFPF